MVTKQPKYRVDLNERERAQLESLLRRAKSSTAMVALAQTGNEIAQQDWDGIVESMRPGINAGGCELAA